MSGAGVTGAGGGATRGPGCAVDEPTDALGARFVKPPAARHPALAADGDGDEALERWRARLEEAGVEVSRAPGRGPLRGLAFRAPDGQAWEVVSGRFDAP